MAVIWEAVRWDDTDADDDDDAEVVCAYCNRRTVRRPWAVATHGATSSSTRQQPPLVHHVCVRVATAVSKDTHQMNSRSTVPHANNSAKRGSTFWARPARLRRN